LNGERVLRYNFRSRPGAADWSIQYGKLSGRAGEEGWFAVDAESLTLRRIFVRAIDAPRELRLKNLSATIDYDPETIAERRILLPDEAQVQVEEGSGIQRVSRLFFDHCRAFGAESTIAIGEEGAGPQSSGIAAKNRLPAGLDVTVSLLAPVSLADAAARDTIAAVVTQPVSYRGKELIAQGAAVEGHLRVRRGENAVVLELDRVQTRAGWAPFYATLANLPPGP